MDKSFATFLRAVAAATVDLAKALEAAEPGEPTLPGLPADPKPPVIEPPFIPTPPKPAALVIPELTFYPAFVDPGKDGTVYVRAVLSSVPQTHIFAEVVTVNDTAREGIEFKRLQRTLIWAPGDPAEQLIPISVYAPKGFDGRSFRLMAMQQENFGLKGPKYMDTRITLKADAAPQLPAARPMNELKAFPAPKGAILYAYDPKTFATGSIGRDAAPQKTPVWSDQLLHGRTQPGNNELGYYAEGAPYVNEAGEIVLPATKLSTPRRIGSQIFDYDASIISSFPFLNPVYGNFTAKIKMPKEDGTWPGFWLLPKDGSWPPEYDGAEFRARDGAKYLVTQHWGSEPGHPKFGGYIPVGSLFGLKNLTDDFHEYGIDWRADKIVTTFGGKVVSEMPNFYGDKPSFVMFDNAVGGWSGTPNIAAGKPAQMLVKDIVIRA